MSMTIQEQIITVILCVAGTMLTRFLPFLVFSAQKPTPKIIEYLGKALPPAIFGMLIIYCLKDVNFLDKMHGLFEIISITLTVVMHLWRRNFLISIASGTICYMILIQV